MLYTLLHIHMQSMVSCQQAHEEHQHQEEERQHGGMHAQLHTMLLVCMHTVTTYT